MRASWIGTRPIEQMALLGFILTNGPLALILANGPSSLIHAHDTLRDCIR